MGQDSALFEHQPVVPFEPAHHLPPPVVHFVWSLVAAGQEAPVGTNVPSGHLIIAVGQVVPVGTVVPSGQVVVVGVGGGVVGGDSVV